jgi:hypothetical protein
VNWSLLQQYEQMSLLGHIAVTMILDHTATVILDTIVVFDIVACVIPLVALLTSSPLMWHEEHV